MSKTIGNGVTNVKLNRFLVWFGFVQDKNTATAARDVNTVLFSMETTYTSCLNWLILSKGKKMFI